MKVPLKTADEIAIMRRGGIIATAALRAVKKAVRAGVTTLELDAIAEKTIRDMGAVPSFQLVPGYSYATCMCVNDVVVHGVPDSVPLSSGDILGIDTGVYLDGFHTDLSYSVIVTESGFWEPSLADISAVVANGVKVKYKRGDVIDFREKQRFLSVGMAALLAAVSQVKVGNHIGDISATLQRYLEGHGYGVVRELIGHGIGTALHEPPQVPGRGVPGEGLELQAGLVLAIEAIYTYGKPGVAYKNNDGWSIATVDYSLSGLYEQTVAVTPTGGEVLTDW